MENPKRNRGARSGWPLAAPHKLIAALALAGAVALPGVAQGQTGEIEACNGSLGNLFVAPTPAVPRFVGDVLRIQSKLTNTAADPWRVNVFEHKLDCADAGNFFTCADEGAVMNFVSVAGTDCQDLSNNPVTWATANGGNLVTFTPSAPVVLDAVGGAQASCNIEFDIQIASLSLDASPFTISGANNADGACFDDLGNTLPGSAQGSVATSVATCGITLKKEVSADAGGTWHDANTQGTAPDVLLNGNALYRLTVANTGTANMSSVLINDGALGIANAQVGPLAGGATKVVTSGDITALNAIARCVENGFLENVSDANGICRADAPAVNDTALDNAWVRCIGVPDIKIVKEISIDNGGTWADANDLGSAPTAVFPSDALYRFTVTNIGTAPLVDVVVNDATLGIVNHPVGNLAVGQVVVLEQGDIPALFVQDRCTNSGTFLNTASTTGASAETGQVVNDSDPANLKCVGTPDISLLKQISVDGGSTWADADAVGDADVPKVAFPSGAMYQFIVKNTGTAPLTNVTVSDPTVGIPPTVIADLAVGQQVIIGSGQFPQMTVAVRCDSSGAFINTASVSAESTETGEGVNDSNPAVLICVGTPNIDILKEISIDGGTTWHDANTEGAAPVAVFPHDAHYRLTVTNIGSAPLVNVVVNDGTLGIVNHVIGNLAPGQMVVLTQGQIPALFVDDRCTRSGTISNVAPTRGNSAETGALVNDSDPAFMVCVGTPAIEIRKDISIDNGVTWFDANDAASAPVAQAPSGALYRFVVTNTGTAPLINVVVADPELGIPSTPIANLAVGQSVIVGSGQIPALNVAERCDSAGEFTNVASVNAQSAETLQGVTDSDPAVLVCRADDSCLTRTPGFWGTHPHVTRQYLPIRVCGEVIDEIAAETGTGGTGSLSSDSSAEAMCMSGVDAKKAGSNMSYLQLVRQLTAAKLNVAASATNEGTCDSVGGVNIDRLIARCELLCDASAKTIAASGCIEQLDAFNNDPEDMDPFGPFVTPGPAVPGECQTATGNGWIIK
jgi:hypothetical protein